MRMNDMRNLETALRAVKQVGKHAQGTISYTVSPVHTIELWVDQARQIEDAGADSICIKDMAGLLTPYVGFELVTSLKRPCYSHSAPCPCHHGSVDQHHYQMC